MHTYKLILVSIDIENVISIFVNAEENLLNILVNKYEGKCFAGCYIVKVITIVRRSECIMMQHNESGDGSIDIQFGAEVIELYQNEIVSGCILIKKDAERKMLIAMTKIDDNVKVNDRHNDRIKHSNPTDDTIPVALNITIDKNFDSLKTEQIIPARIIRCLYSIGNDKIQAFAKPWIPNQLPVIIYNCSELTVTKEDLIIIEKLSALSMKQKKHLETLDKKEIAFFSDIIYPFKTKFSGRDLKSKKYDLLSMVLTTTTTTTKYKYLSRHPGTDVMDSSIYEWDSSTSSDLTGIQTEVKTFTTMAEVLSGLLIEYYSQMKLITDFCYNYSTKQKKEAHINLWKIYKSAQLELK